MSDIGARARHMQALADPMAREVIEVMLPQLLIVLVTQLGGDVTVSVADIDATGDHNLTMSFDQEAQTFTFKSECKK